MARIPRLNLRFSARAKNQLLAIQDYIKERNPSAAERVGTRISQAADMLRSFPQAGRPGRSPGTREWVVRGLPYILVYEISGGEDEITGNELVVLAVFHGAQDR